MPGASWLAGCRRQDPSFSTSAHLPTEASTSGKVFRTAANRSAANSRTLSGLWSVSWDGPTAGMFSP